MRASETTFKQLVQGDKQFQVPLYQRPYSWQDQHLKKLWTDIREYTNGGGGASTHFLGSVVLAPSVVGPSGLQSWIVVDGQQRLTTLMVALCAIRDHLAVAQPQQRERVNETYLTNKWHPGDDFAKLMPTKADRTAFLACLRSTADVGGPDNVGAAYRFFKQRLAGASDPQDPFEVEEIERVISDRLALVAITADADDNVHRIFESLNNTGLNLTQADLVRNLIFMLLPTQGDLVYESIWLPMQRRLTPDQLEDLFYLYLVLNGDERVRRDGVYQGVQRVLERKRGDETAVEAIVSDLARRSIHLQRIVAPVNEADSRLRAAFERLAAWGAQVAHPALMLLLDKQEHAQVSPDELVTAVAYIESFLVRRTICEVPTNNLNRIFNTLVSQLPTDQPTAEAVRMVLSRERSFWPDDIQLREAIAHKPFYWRGRPGQQQIVLRRLEESYPSAERVDFARAQLTIEHVLPQTPTPEWLSALAPETDEGETAEDLHRRLLHTLGNLTLTGYNTQLSNNPFERKQQLLQQSSLELNKRIAATERWGRREIEERASELADRAIVIWPGPLAGVHVDAGRDWHLLDQAMAAVPAGSWTTYADVAALIGSHPVPVGQHLANAPVPNGHRALKSDGTISPGFRWTDPADTREAKQVLSQEGVRFDQSGAADPAQRLSARDLAALIGLEVDDVTELPAEGGSTQRRRAAFPDFPELEERHSRFATQVADRHGPDVSGAIHRLMDDWVALGGALGFGPAAETSCFFLCPGDPNGPWPFTIYPSGSVEVVFQHMVRRPPFDDLRLRDEFRTRLNEVPGILIPEAKLSLRPSFPLRLLTSSAEYEGVLDSLRWFADVVQRNAESS